VVKLDETLGQGKPIDLRTPNEKIVIENWKGKYSKGESDHEESNEHDDHHH
jgi:hypothetical protein